MNNQEIERKFLIDFNKLPGCLKPIRIAQGYLNSSPERTVRIRIAGECGFITIKGPSTEDGLSRFEWEHKISVDYAEILLGYCEPGIIEKFRYYMIHKSKLWEIDVFHGDNAGLVVAEIELNTEDEHVDLPEWVIEEVTGDTKYYNSQLVSNPYKNWVDPDYYRAGMDLMGEIYANFSNADKLWFQTEDPVMMHHTLGMHLRNHCNMWKAKWVPELIGGVDHSPNHPDAISQKVIKDFQHKIKQNLLYGPFL